MKPDYLTIETARDRFAARAAGDPGQPVALCLHSYHNDASTFDELLDWLAGHGFRAIAPVRRGSVRTPLASLPHEHDPIASAARDVLAIVDAISPTQPVWVVGHGSGALVAYRAMSEAPDRFVRAVALSACHPGKRRVWWKCPGDRALALLTRMLRSSREVSHSEAHPSRSCQPIGLIRTPTLQLFGALDRTISPAQIEGQSQWFTAAHRSEIIANLGHDLHQEAPKQIAHEIVDWLTMPATAVLGSTSRSHHPRPQVPAEWGRVMAWSQPMPVEWSWFAS